MVSVRRTALPPSGGSRLRAPWNKALPTFQEMQPHVVLFFTQDGAVEHYKKKKRKEKSLWLSRVQTVSESQWSLVCNSEYAVTLCAWTVLGVHRCEERIRKTRSIINAVPYVESRLLVEEGVGVVS